MTVSLYVALSADDDARMYGYANGAGHVLLIPADAMNDPLCVGGIIETACGGKGVDSSRLTEKFIGDKMCARCVKWLASDGARNDVEAAREAKYARYADGVEGGPELGADVSRVVQEIFAPEMGIDGKPWIPGDNPARRAPENRPEVGESAPVKVTAVGTPTAEPSESDRAELIAQERARRAKGACGGTGEPPVPGTRVQRDDHTVSVPDDFNGKTSGKCPEETCGRIIAVSREGGMRRHKAPVVPVAREESASEPSGQLAAFRIGGEPVSGSSEDERVELRKYPTTRKDVTPGFDRRAVEPVDGRCGVHYRRNGLGWIAYANTLPGAVSGKGRTIDAATDAMLSALDAEESGTDAREGSERIWGLTWNELRTRNAAHYAIHPMSEAVATLPDPYNVKREWSGTNGAEETEYRGCFGAGLVGVVNPERTHGKCPECRAYIPLLDTKDDDDFRIGSHYEYGLTPPANSKRLTSRSIETVEHGSIPGSPMDADKRRGTEAKCVKSNKDSRRKDGGKHKCPGCARSVELVKRLATVKGETKIKWIIPNHYRPVTDENKVDSFRRAGADGRAERKVTPRGNGADAGKGQRDHGSIDGAANTGRQNMAPVRPGGWVGKAGTMSLPATVRPGVDPEVTGDICPICEERVDIAHKGKSRSWKRNHSKRLRGYWMAREAERIAEREADIAAGRIIPADVRKALRKAASIGSFSEGTVAGKVAHGGKRPEVAPKLTPRGMTRAGK